MNYLTQYYKNRCDQLQEQISQINYSLRHLAEASAGMAVDGERPTSSGGGGGYDDSASAYQNSGGFDGAYFGQLLGSNPAAAYAYAASFQNGGAQASGGNGVGAAAQRIMAGKNPASMSQSGGGNDVDKFLGQLASQGQGGNGSAFSGAALGQILAAQGGAAGQGYANQFTASQAGKGIQQSGGFRPGDKRRRV